MRGDSALSWPGRQHGSADSAPMGPNTEIKSNFSLRKRIPSRYIAERCLARSPTGSACRLRECSRPLTERRGT